MAIRVALNHKTVYNYDRLVSIGPQIVRLRPAPHCRTPIHSYSLKVRPEEHFINWQQDPHGNFLARYVFDKPAHALSIEVELIAEMTVINPFDFFVEESADQFPFTYDPWLANELQPFLETNDPGPRFAAFLAGIDRGPAKTVDMLVALNQKLQQDISYLIRMETGVQSPEETLTHRSGSCRDSAWLLVQTLRHLGLAARFVSGYLIQLAPDIRPLDGPAGPTADFTDLHAWTEVYLPGAGWIGLDPTSGLFAGEGHIPLACTPNPSSAAPVTGSIGECEVEFAFHMDVTRIHEDPRVTKPYTDEQWEQITQLGQRVDATLNDEGVRLTIGGEPTFVSMDDMDGAEWMTAAVGPDKRRLSETLIKRLREQFAPGGLLHYGQGKWYPGESLPRWSLGVYWRKDGVPIWENASLIADFDHDYGLGPDAARRFTRHLAQVLGVSGEYIIPAYEDVAHYLLKEQRLPVNVDPADSKLSNPEERARLARVFQRGVGEPIGFVMPLKRQMWQGRAPHGHVEQKPPVRPDKPRSPVENPLLRWVSGPWPIRSERMFLLPGDSPLGLRLPLESLPWVAPAQLPKSYPADPLEERPPLPIPSYRQQQFVTGAPEPVPVEPVATPASRSPAPFVRTALCVEPREGRLHVFMPPVDMLEDYLDLVAAIERTAEDLQMPIVLEGYLPPNDARIQNIKVTPDPGVIEVNTHPVDSWDELVDNTIALYDVARETRLSTEKFDLDGTHRGTGGGNHVVLGGATAADSPFLRRPDLLKSLIGYWINHPSLSYLFSGRFIGPTSQAPRVDEGRRDALYELELAFSLAPKRGESSPPWLVDRLFRNLLIDLTGNTHRAEFCIDKLYSPDNSSGRLGLVELRGFEMPPHAKMSLTQQLLIRALVARFWQQPYEEPLIDWGTSLHDLFLLPHFAWKDFGEVLDEL
ncbi:MAG: transglutaminase family protein, partial [Planctomycetaceae bacterium]|nr:transglutaminase family protein [Planctomycetaceae bacterium]